MMSDTESDLAQQVTREARGGSLAGIRFASYYCTYPFPRYPRCGLGVCDIEGCTLQVDAVYATQTTHV